jgi:hypothetical protein
MYTYLDHDAYASNHEAGIQTLHVESPRSYPCSLPKVTAAVGAGAISVEGGEGSIYPSSASALVLSISRSNGGERTMNCVMGQA